MKNINYACDIEEKFITFIVILSLGFIIVFFLTPIKDLVSNYFSENIVRATDLEVAFNCESYNQKNSTIFEKILGLICYVVGGDYSLSSKITLLTPLLLTFFTSFFLSFYLLSRYKDKFYLYLFFSLMLSTSLTLNPYFLGWFSVPYMFFYFLFLIYIAVCYYYFFIKNCLSSSEVIFLFLLNLLIFAILWDISFHFIPYMIIFSFFSIIISFNCRKYKIILLLVLFLSLTLSTIFSKRTVPFLLYSREIIIDQKINFWESNTVLNIFTLTKGGGDNQYLKNYTHLVRITNFFIPLLIIFSFIILKEDIYIRKRFLLYILVLSLGIFSLILSTNSELHLHFISNSSYSAPVFQKLLYGFILINRRPDRLLNFLWIINWIMVYDISFYIFRTVNKRSKNFVLFLFLLYIYILSIILPNILLREELIEQHMKFIDKETFNTYLKFLDYTNNVTYGKSYFIPFYTNIMMDNRVNYRNTIFYYSFYENRENEIYRTFFIILNETFGNFYNQKTPIYEKLKDLKKIIIGAKLSNITKIGIISSKFSEIEFQNWRLKGSIRFVYPYIWGSPEYFENRAREFISIFTNLSNDNSRIKIVDLDGYKIIEFQTTYKYKECIFHLPENLRDDKNIEVIQLLADVFPEYMLGELSQCEKIDLRFDGNNKRILLKFGKDAYALNWTREIISIRELFNESIIFGDVKYDESCKCYIGSKNLSIWYRIKREKLIEHYNEKSSFCIFLDDLSNEHSNTWIRIISKDGKVVYNFNPSCYYISDIINSEESYYVAISINLKNTKKFKIMAKIVSYSFEKV